MKVILLQRFDRRGDITDTQIYLGLSRLIREEELIFHEKPLSPRMIYQRFQDRGKVLKGDGWKMTQIEVKRSLARRKNHDTI